MLGIIDDIVIKVCEKLPLSFSLFEKDGFCGKPNKNCDYCIENSGNCRDIYFCNKKTYTRIPEPEGT